MSNENRIFDDAFLKRLDSLSLRFTKAVNTSYTGGRRSKALGSTVEFSNFREYNQGDDFRRIDWNAYARFEKFFIKLFLDEKQLNVRIFIDLSASMDFGEPTKLTAAKKLAAAFAYLAFRARDKVEIIGLSDGGSEAISGSVTTLQGFYRTLEVLENTEAHGDTRLDSSLRGIKGIHPGDGAAILISDLMSDEEYKKALDYLLFMRQEVIVIHLLCPEEIDPQLEGMLRLEDSEKNTFCEINATQETLSYYQKALEEFRNQIKSLCMSRGITLICASSDEDMENVLIERAGNTGLIG